MTSYMVEALGLLPNAPDGFASLRQFILDLAMSGRLVEQNPEDEPAHVLRARIAKARAELFGAAKVRGVGKDDGAASPGRSVSLPSSWLMVPLTDVYVTVSANGGQLLSSQIVGAGKVPVVDQGKRFIAGYTDREDLVIKLPGPVVVFGDHTTERKYIDFDFVVGADGVKILRPILVNARFFWMQLVGYRLESRGYARHFKVLNACWFALPPLDEQHRIVAKVDELMALCDRLEARQQDAEAAHARLVQALLDSLTQARDADEFQACRQRVAEQFSTVFSTDQSVMALERAIHTFALRGLLTDSGGRSAIGSADAPYPVPKAWAWQTLADVTSLLTDGEHLTPARTNDRSQVPLATAKNVRNGHIDLTDTDFVTKDVAERCWSRCRPAAGDVLMVSVGATLGRLSVLREQRDMVIVRSVALFRPRGVAPDYLALALQSPLLQGEIWSRVKQSAQPCLYLSQAKQLQIPVPPLEQQLEIVAKVTELLGLCDQLKTRIAAARAKHAQLAEALVAQAVAA